MEENETQHHPADQTVGPRAKHGQVGENEISRDWGKPQKPPTNTTRNIQESPFLRISSVIFFAEHLVRLNLPFEWW